MCNVYRLRNELHISTRARKISRLVQKIYGIHKFCQVLLRVRRNEYTSCRSIEDSSVSQAYHGVGNRPSVSSKRYPGTSKIQVAQFCNWQSAWSATEKFASKFQSSTIARSLYLSIGHRATFYTFRSFSLSLFPSYRPSFFLVSPLATDVESFLLVLVRYSPAELSRIFDIRYSFRFFCFS